MSTKHSGWKTALDVACRSILILVASAGAMADPVEPTSPQADCVLAIVDGVRVTERDARSLQALLSPPPAPAAARRLAVDAALAWWDVHGWLAGSSNRGRLEAWRAWLTVGTDESHTALDVRHLARDLGSVAARAGLEHGSCADPSSTSALPSEDGATADRGARARDLLDRASRSESHHRLRILRVESLDPETPVDAASLEALADELGRRGLVTSLRDVSLAVSRLDRPLAEAAAALADGSVAGPVRTRDGVFWLEARRSAP